jgi:hypothetical protein
VELVVVEVVELVVGVIVLVFEVLVVVLEVVELVVVVVVVVVASVEPVSAGTPDIVYIWITDTPPQYSYALYTHWTFASDIGTWVLLLGFHPNPQKHWLVKISDLTLPVTNILSDLLSIFNSNDGKLHNVVVSHTITNTHTIFGSHCICPLVG